MVLYILHTVESNSLEVVCTTVFCHLQEELSLAGYRRHQESQKAAPPLSQSEIALQELQQNEVSHSQYQHKKSSHCAARDV